MSENAYIGPDEIIRKKREFLVPCSYHFYKTPPQLVKALGTRVWDSEGNEYCDFFAGVSVMACGHCNPAINERVIKQINTLQHTTSIYLTQPVVDLAQRLAEVLPGDISRSFFCNSGSEANEGAMLLARLYTRKKGFIALEGGLHGRTFLTAAATEIPMWRTDPWLDEQEIHFVRDIQGLVKVLDEHGDNIAGFMFEALQGNGGIRPVDGNFISAAIPLLRDRRILIIADEIQSGFGRTGKMFAVEHYDVVPDIITGAKALGNGFPIGFYAASDTVASIFTKPSASTLGGNPVSATAGLAVLDFIRDNSLVERAQELGAFLRERLESIAAEHSFLEAPRGMGLMLGMELSPQTAPGGDAAAATDAILEGMKNAGYLIGKNGLGRNVLAFQPPLVISRDEIIKMTEQLARVISEVLKNA